MTIDWSKAPEGAQWYVDGESFYYWYKTTDSGMRFEYCGEWRPSKYKTVDDMVAAGLTVTPRPAAQWPTQKAYTRDEALQFLVERLDSWPTDIADAPLCPGWGWASTRHGNNYLARTDDFSTAIYRDEWRTAHGPDFVPFVSVEDAQPVAGQKFDTGKPIIGAIPPHAELAVARVMTFGAQKYARDNWRKIDDIPTRYMDAALRHLNAVRRGETADPESGEHHLAHAACCILFMLDVAEAVNAQTDR
ncbi:MAG: dATP/dGTP diphosphohydrolase domain-containing protein [Plesiomonas shigelloides]